MRSRRRDHSLSRAGVAATLTAVLAVGLLASPASADRRDDLEDQQQENAAEREQVESSLEGTNSELADLYLALDETNRRLPEAQTELDLANERLAAAEREHESVQQRLEVARAQQDDLNEEIEGGNADIDSTEGAMGDVARSAYRGDNSISTMSVILSASSPEEFASGYSVMNSALSTQNQRLTELEELQAVNRNRQARLDAVEERITELEAEAAQAVKEADQARSDAEDLLAEIEQLKKDQESQKRDLEAAKQQSEDRLDEIRSDDADIASEIQEIARREAAERERQQAAARQSSGGGSGNSGGNSSGGGGNSGGGGGSGSLIPPINRALYVTSPWGYRVYPITGGWFMHNGVDLRSACGERQHASAAGTVTAVRGAAGNGTHGNQVMINHGVMGGNSYVTVYNHLSGFAVSPGQHVSQGETIGYTGATGNVTGCHAHFEVWRNGQTINPMTLPGF